MVIKSNAASDELSPPFFKSNEKFCSEFETFIAKKNGEVKGQFNAWSYLIYGKISSPKNWTLMYKKSTFSSGNLLLSSKRQNLLVLAEWTTNGVGSHNSEFVIRKKKQSDIIKIKFSNSLSEHKLSKKYVVESQKEDASLILGLTEILSDLFISNEIYRVEQKNNKLTIELRSEKHHFDIFEKLLQM